MEHPDIFLSTPKRKAFKVHRLAPLLVSLCGSLGIATTLTFFIGIYLSFLPNWQAWKEFFVPNALWLMAIPYILLMLYLFLRTALSHWLLERGQIDQTLEYTASRIRPNLVRSRREALTHRLVRVMAFVQKGEYLAARALLAEIHDQKIPIPSNARATLSIANWHMELALRLQDDPTVETQFNNTKNLLKPAPLHAQALACRAELALRHNQTELYEKLITEAFWTDPDSKRAQLTRALASLTFARDTEQFAQAAALLQLVQTQACNDIPLRAAELGALQALALFKGNHNEQALQALENAIQLPADEWSRKVIDSVAALLKPDAS